MAKYFIDHPVFACVIAIIITLVGIGLVLSVYRMETEGKRQPAPAAGKPISRPVRKETGRWSR